MYAEVVDSQGNIHASDPIYREIRPANLPDGDFTSPYRARGEVILDSNGTVSGIELSSPGAAYNSPPKIIIEGDGVGATASAKLMWLEAQEQFCLLISQIQVVVTHLLALLLTKGL